MAEERIETLVAEKGSKYEEDGQAIASTERSIVFMPKGVEPDESYRVRLHEIREDSRGRMMYRATPADIEYTERWKDNSDGTASNITIAISWTLEESEVGTVETKKLETREGTPHSRDDRQVKWGKDFASSQVEVVKVNIIPLEAEQVSNGKLVWSKTSEREEKEAPVFFPISKVEVNSGQWRREKLNVNYDNSSSIEGNIYFHSDSDHWFSFSSTWGEMPEWWTKEQEARYPVCSCGRQRRDTQVEDGYAKCELCRAEETCVRCGKQAKVKNFSGRLVCDDCQHYEEQEQLIHQYLPQAYLTQITDEAKKLLTGQALEGELGLAVLKAGLGHISSESTRDRILQNWGGYRWYYFTNTDDGVFGTKFEPAALQVLQFISQATGNSLVELVAWLVEGSNFYIKQQVESDEGAKPELTEDQLGDIKAKLEAVKDLLADWLRGSETDRVAVIKGLQKIADAPEQHAKVWNALQQKEQNYSQALEVLREVEEEAAGLLNLRKLLAVEYSVCPVCEEKWPAEDGAVCACLEDDELLEPPFTIKQSIAKGERFVSVECEADGHYNDVRLIVHQSSVPDISEIKTEMLWVPPKEEERVLWQKVRDLEAELEQIYEELERCEGDYASRIGLSFEQDRERGNLFALASLLHETQVEFQGDWKTLSGKVHFVCNNRCGDWLEDLPQDGETWSCSLGTHPRMIGYDKKDRPIIIVHPQAKIDNGKREALEAQIETVKAEIYKLQNGVSRNPSESDDTEDEKIEDKLQDLMTKWGK